MPSENSVAQRGPSRERIIESDLREQRIFMDEKYDMEHKLLDTQHSWRENEMSDLLQLIDNICDDCFGPGQLYLRTQIHEEEGNQKDCRHGKITSVDLV